MRYLPDVSIRAPAKGATLAVPVAVPSGVSIRAPAKGATRSPGRCLQGFDPRPREGGDPVGVLDRARGSAPPRRGRRHPRRLCAASSTFRSAPPRRGRLRNIRGHCFRSAPPRRGRRGRPDGARVSIRAPAKGATVSSAPAPAPATSCHVSIRAPAKGATPIPRDVTSSVSIRAPAKGATWRPIAAFASFDPRPREGGDGGTVSSCHSSNNAPGCANPGGGAGTADHASDQAGDIYNVNERLAGRANLALEPRVLPVRAHQNTSGPSRSSAGVAPTCSTRRLPSAPSR